LRGGVSIQIQTSNLKPPPSNVVNSEPWRRRVKTARGFASSGNPGAASSGVIVASVPDIPFDPLALR
jgi:hypothetical protein